MRNDLAEMGEDVFVKRTQYEEARATIIKDKEERGKTIGDLQTNLNNQGDELEELRRQIRKKDMEMTEERMIRTNVANDTTFGLPLSSWGSRDEGAEAGGIGQLTEPPGLKNVHGGSAIVPGRDGGPIVCQPEAVTNNGEKKNNLQAVPARSRTVPQAAAGVLDDEIAGSASEEDESCQKHGRKF